MWESLNRDITGFDRNYDEFEDLVEKHGKNKILIIFSLIDLKRTMKENKVFSREKVQKNMEKSPETNLLQE